MVKTIFGGATISATSRYSTKESAAEVLDILLAEGVTTLDTARLYAGSEVAIGQQDKRAQFTIDTKLVGGFQPGNVTKESVIKDAKDSLDRVGIQQFDILYIHAPDPTIPIEDTLSGIAEAYKSGLFRRFGLSNFSATQVQEVHDICQANAYPLPTVYQGNYNPIARHSETTLFPTLHKLGIKFYAYSPLAGGFLTKTADDLDAGAGRFNAQALGGLYSKLYDNPTMRQALVSWNKIAGDEGISTAELAYRWVAHHSALAGDAENGVIFGASRMAQVRETAIYLKRGVLSEHAVRGIEGIWETVKDDAPTDNYAEFSKN